MGHPVTPLMARGRPLAGIAPGWPRVIASCILTHNYYYSWLYPRLTNVSKSFLNSIEKTRPGASDIIVHNCDILSLIPSTQREKGY